MLTRYILAAAALIFVLPSHRANSSHLVWQEDKHFSVADMSIAVGDTVVFSNEDKVIHNIFSSSEGNQFNLRRQNPGMQSAVVFSHAGTVLVRCAFHPSMRLALDVH